MSKLTQENTVFYSTSNDNYAVYAAVSLLSVRKHIKNARLYILGKEFSKKTKTFLKKNNIGVIETDLTYLFYQTWEYPMECYYIFAGPEIFQKMGFSYSVYLDGDILCLNNPLENVDFQTIGGVQANTYAEIFGDNAKKIADIANVDSVRLKNKRLHSGVIYFDNQKNKDAELLQKAGELYDRCWKKAIPRKGDDSLFALYQLTSQKSHVTKLADYYNYMPHYKGFQENDDIIFFHFTFDKPWKYQPYHHADIQHDIYNDYTKLWRAIYRKCATLHWLGHLAPVIKMQNIRKKVSNLLYKSWCWTQGLCYSPFRRLMNVRKKALLLYWFVGYNYTEPFNNFGDEVSKDIIQELFGYNVESSSIDDCDLMCAGSIIEVGQSAKRHNKFYAWGSGFIREDGNEKGLDKINFTAVRGQKSVSRLKQELPTGDPGILANITYRVKRKKGKKIGVVIHYADMKLPLTKKFCKDKRFRVINPLDTPRSVINQMKDCRLVLSSSLHGLIFADSLGIPNAHIKISNNLTGGDYKFYDYCSGVGKKYKPADVERIFDDKYFDDLIERYQPIPNLKKKQKDLIKSFPYK